MGYIPHYPPYDSKETKTPTKKQKLQKYEIVEIDILLSKNDGILYSVEYLYNSKKVIFLKS